MRPRLNSARLAAGIEEEHDVDIRIGMKNVARELNIEIADDEATTVTGDVEAALAGDSSVLWITDRNGKRTGVVVADLAYVELGSTTGRTIGFGS